MSRSALSLLIVGVLLVLAAPASAAAAPRWQALDHVPHELPPAGARAAGASEWIVGARATATSAALAARHGAAAVDGLAGAYAVPTGRARAFAGALRARGLLRYSEPNGTLRRTSSFEGPEGVTPWARSFVVPAGLAPPAGASIGIVDDLVDPTVPDTAQAKMVKGSAAKTVLDGHGTAVASVAAGQADGLGVIGVTPGAPILSFGLKRSSCAEVARGIVELSLAGVKVLNLSLGTTEDCFLLNLAVADAFANGTLVVAASGNEFEAGNPIVYPAAYPHVLSVGAIDVERQPTYFSSANAALDLAAPGDDVPVALPPKFDTADGRADGLTDEDGTSFASPMVAGVASWLIAARPKLEPAQYADLLRHSATDLGPAGWDSSTGFGLVNLAGALQGATPRIDPLEPNDGITFVNGVAYGKPSPYVWTGGAARTIRASVDAVEDPVDVYRIRLRAREKAKVALKPSVGNADLRLYDGAAKGLQAKILWRSSRSGTATDTIRPVNRRAKARTFYVVVIAPSVKSRAFDAQYELRVTRR